jgi:deoxyribonuclease V
VDDHAARRDAWLRAAADAGWNLTPAEARALQERLRDRVIASGSLPPEAVRLVAGTDIAAGRPEGPGRAAVVVLEYPSLRPVEQAVYEAPLRFPYIPGLLSFREIPLLLPAFARLRALPDLVVVDGQGIAHPRRFGIAAHLGVLLDLPAIGCAKSRLIGTHDPPSDERGAWTPLRDHGETIGAVVRTRPGTRPVYVSVGHRLALEEAVTWVLRLARGYRLPEPTRLAHQAAAGTDVVARGVKGWRLQPN